MDLVDDFLKPIVIADFAHLERSLDRLADEPDASIEGFLRYIAQALEKDPLHAGANARLAEGYRCIKAHFAKMAIRSVTRTLC